MRISNPNIGATSVMFVVMKKRAKLLALLTKNGIKYPSNATDLQLALIVTNLLKTSKSFRIEFEQLVTEPDVIVGVFSGMDGAYSNFTFNPNQFDPNYFSTGTSKPTTNLGLQKPAKEKKDGNFFGNALSLLQTGFAGYLALDENKTQKALADASVKIKDNDVKLAELGILPSGNETKVAGLSTGTIVGLSIGGIVLVGAIVYFVTKKKAV
jgi:hypothetical protein